MEEILDDLVQYIKSDSFWLRVYTAVALQQLTQKHSSSYNRMAHGVHSQHDNLGEEAADAALAALGFVKEADR